MVMEEHPQFGFIIWSIVSMTGMMQNHPQMVCPQRERVHEIPIFIDGESPIHIIPNISPLLLAIPIVACPTKN